LVWGIAADRYGRAGFGAAIIKDRSGFTHFEGFND
jgi:hypothetical protein